MQEDKVWVAECVESEATGEGATTDDAIASLRTALETRLLRPDAIAPPERAARPVIDLEPA